MSALLIGAAAGGAVPAHAQLQVVDLFLKINPPHLNPVSHALKFTWSDPGSDVAVLGLKRDAGGSLVPFPPNEPNTAYDYTWVSGTHYEYYLVGFRTVTYTDPNTGETTSYTVAWQSNHVTIRPCDVSASQTGTADSRVDKRYGDIHYQDYPFSADPKPNNKPGVYLYRGGLYAGHNSDGSETGRSYLKLPLVPPDTVDGAIEKLYSLGGLWAFSPRLARTGSVSVVCQRGDSSTWTPATLVWTNAPSPIGSATASKQVSWDRQNPVSAWYVLDALQLIDDQIASTGGTTMTALLMSSSETPGAGWAYFAANPYQHKVLKSDNTIDTTSGYGPRLLYAWGGEGLNGGNSGGGGDGGDGGDGGPQGFSVKKKKAGAKP